MSKATTIHKKTETAPAPEPTYEKVTTYRAETTASSNAQYLAAARSEEALQAETVDQRIARQEKAQVEKRAAKAGIPPTKDEPVTPPYPNPLTPLQKLHKALVAAKREAEKPDAKEAAKHINEAKGLAEKLLGA